MDTETEQPDTTPNPQEEFISSFNYIQRRAHSNAQNKGFWDQFQESYQILQEAGRQDLADALRVTHILKTLALVHEEVSEGASAWRENNKNDDKITDMSGLEVELGDAVIRIMDLAGKLNLNIAKAIIRKMDYNSLRERMHGKLA